LIPIPSSPLGGSMGLSRWAVWNYAPPSESVPEKTISLKFAGVAANALATIWRVDVSHGNALTTYKAMGAPVSPTIAQIEQLRAAALLPPPEKRALQQGVIIVQVPSQGLVLLEIP